MDTTYDATPSSPRNSTCSIHSTSSSPSTRSSISLLSITSLPPNPPSTSLILTLLIALYLIPHPLLLFLLFLHSSPRYLYPLLTLLLSLLLSFFSIALLHLPPHLLSYFSLMSDSSIYHFVRWISGQGLRKEGDERWRKGWMALRSGIWGGVVAWVAWWGILVGIAAVGGLIWGVAGLVLVAGEAVWMGWVMVVGGMAAGKFRGGEEEGVDY